MNKKEGREKQNRIVASSCVFKVYELHNIYVLLKSKYNSILIVHSLEVIVLLYCDFTSNDLSRKTIFQEYNPCRWQELSFPEGWSSVQKWIFCLQWAAFKTICIKSFYMCVMRRNLLFLRKRLQNGPKDKQTFNNS